MCTSRMRLLTRADLPSFMRSPQRLITIRRVLLGQPAFLAEALLLTSYSLVVLLFVAPRNLIEHFDLWYQITLGNIANFNRPQTLVSGFYPIGYPLLLRAAITQGIDVLRFAQSLSWLGGAFVLLAVFSISYGILRSALLALALNLLLVGNINFIQRATTEGTDLLAAGLQ